MKKLLLSLILLSSIAIGCSFIQERRADVETCLQDPVCKENAEKWQDRAELVATPIAAAIPVPGAAVAPKIIGYGAFGLSLLLGGYALRKKKKETV